MFGFRRRTPKQTSEETKLRLWLALNDQADVSRVATAIKRTAGEKLSDQECIKCAAGLRIKWVASLATGAADKEMISTISRNSFPQLSPEKHGAIARLITDATPMSYEECVARASAIETGLGREKAAQVEPEPTLFVNAEAGEQNLTLRSGAGTLQMNGAVLTVILLVAKRQGWQGGRDLFMGHDLAMVKKFKSSRVSGMDARCLRTIFDDVLKGKNPEHEETKVLLDFAELLDGSDLFITAGA